MGQRDRDSSLAPSSAVWRGSCSCIIIIIIIINDSRIPAGQGGVLGWFLVWNHSQELLQQQGDCQCEVHSPRVCVWECSPLPSCSPPGAPSWLGRGTPGCPGVCRGSRDAEGSTLGDAAELSLPGKEGKAVTLSALGWDGCEGGTELLSRRLFQPA